MYFLLDICDNLIQNLMMDAEALKYCLKLADTYQNGTLDFEAKFSLTF